MKISESFCDCLWKKRRSEYRNRSLNIVDSVGPSRLVTIDGKQYLNVSSNDYLNLSNHPKFIDRSIEYTHTFGTSSSSFRSITDALEIHKQAVVPVASLYQKEDCKKLVDLL